MTDSISPDGARSVQPRVLVVMPAYNEGASIAAVLTEVLASLPDADVLVVDDGSRDDTARVARQFPVRVASHPFNVGVGGAMRTGFRYAAERGYGVVVQIDADGQHVAGQARALIDATSTADVVIGSRFASGAGYEVHPVRFASMRIVAGLMSKVVRSPLTDSTSGFRAFSCSAIELFAQHYPHEYLGDTVESLVLARRTNLRVVEVPVSMRPRLAGSPSQNTLASVGYAGRAVATIFLGLVRPRPVMTGAVR